MSIATTRREKVRGGFVPLRVLALALSPLLSSPLSLSRVNFEGESLAHALPPCRQEKEKRKRKKKKKPIYSPTPLFF